MDITIFTDLTSYTFLDEVVPNVSQGSRFFGFESMPGELITGFSIASEGTGAFPGLDNVTLGRVSVPEPTTLLLLGLGLAGLGFARKRAH